MRLASLARTVGIALVAAGCAGVAHADKAPPPPAPRIVLDRIEATLCGHDDKDAPCPAGIVDATKQAVVASLQALVDRPITCHGERAGTHALHLYWGDNFGSVVHIDFDQQSAGLPDCAANLVQVTTDALTERVKPIGDKDASLRVNWTVTFKLVFDAK